MTQLRRCYTRRPASTANRLVTFSDSMPGVLFLLIQCLEYFFFLFNARSTFPLEGVLEAAIERQKAELDRVGADYKEAAGFRLNQFFGLLFVTIEF